MVQEETLPIETEGGPEAETAEDNTSESPATEETLGPGSELLSPGGAIIFMIAGVFDLAGLICLVLYLAFGVGVLVGRIVSWTGLGLVSLLLMLKGRSAPKIELPDFKKTSFKTAVKAKGASREAVEKGLIKFLGRNKWRFLSEFAPVVGDFVPGLTWMVVKELK